MASDMGRILRRGIRAFPPAAYLFIPVLKLKDRLGTGEMHRDMGSMIATFCTPAQQADTAYMRRTRRDMWYSFLRYHCPFDEYFLFHFSRLSPTARHEFVTDYEKDEVCTRLSSADLRRIFADKGQAYLRFAPYYKRDGFIPGVSGGQEDFERFVAAHPRYIVKPCLESCGRGVRIVEDGDTSPARLEAYRREGVILEELICQDEALGRFHPGSVNTVRCATFLKDGEVHILFTFLRLGRGSSIVDNGGAGGLFVCVDTDTGICVSPGVAEDLYTTILHPDTGLQILGFVVPRWDEMKALARELALVVPEQPYVSWDLALTPGGWVMVEGNSEGQFIGPQLTMQRGMRQTLSRFFDIEP